MQYKKPEFLKTPYTCPHCNTNSKQEWYHISGEKRSPEIPKKKVFYENIFTKSYNVEHKVSINPYMLAQCDSCQEITIWFVERKTPELNKGELEIKFKARVSFYSEHIGKMIYPHFGGAPEINEDLIDNEIYEEIVRDYNEAGLILKSSPRGSCALLRLCIEKLCIIHKAKGKTLYHKIENLIEETELSESVKVALHAVRIIGNESIHTGELRMDDNFVIAIKLFKLLNFITQELITKERIISEIEEIIPETKKEPIKKIRGKE